MLSINAASMILVVLRELLTTTQLRLWTVQGSTCCPSPSASRLVPGHTDHLVVVKGWPGPLIVALQCF